MTASTSSPNSNLICEGVVQLARELWNTEHSDEMRALLILWAALLAVVNGFILSRPLGRMARLSPPRALKEAVFGMMEEMKADFEMLKTAYDIDEIKRMLPGTLSREQELVLNMDITLESMRTLQGIDEDLLMFEHAARSGDANEREKAEIFKKEFLRIQAGLETELNRLVEIQEEGEEGEEAQQQPQADG